MLFALNPSSSLLPFLCFLHCRSVLQILKHLFDWHCPADPSSLTWLSWWSCPSLPKFSQLAKPKICLSLSPVESNSAWWGIRIRKRTSLGCLFSWLYVSIFHQPFHMSNKLVILQLMLSGLLGFASSFLIQIYICWGLHWSTATYRNPDFI